MLSRGRPGGGNEWDTKSSRTTIEVQDQAERCGGSNGGPFCICATSLRPHSAPQQTRAANHRPCNEMSASGALHSTRAPVCNLQPRHPHRSRALPAFARRGDDRLLGEARQREGGERRPFAPPASGTETRSGRHPWHDTERISAAAGCAADEAAAPATGARADPAKAAGSAAAVGIEERASSAAGTAEISAADAAAVEAAAGVGSSAEVALTTGEPGTGAARGEAGEAVTTVATAATIRTWAIACARAGGM
jgi:hypothetical protein